MPTLYFEDFTEGREFVLPSYEVKAEEIVAFARQFDPAPFHLDEEAGKETMLGGMAASGWHTCAMAMSMMCDAYLLDSAGQGMVGVKKCRWLEPVRAGDTLSGKATVTGARPSNSRPGIGLVTFLTHLENQNGETVVDFSDTVLLLMREAA